MQLYNQAVNAYVRTAIYPYYYYYLNSIQRRLLVSHLLPPFFKATLSLSMSLVLSLLLSPSLYVLKFSVCLLARIPTLFALLPSF
ncbi:hypothetical protein F4678DRAFT_449807 [Xylaria arbuscula]|nr:hypothetical protein F4678DRAFT_449807 [Xylaria arbuscula]